MALTVFGDSPDSISLEEFSAFAMAEMDPSDPESVISMAPALKRLANDKHLLVRELHRLLATDVVETEAAGYSSQSLVLRSTSKFLVRANIWVKSSVYAGSTTWEDHLYSYYFPHNHNFQLLTVGYYGPGYSTTVYEIEDPDAPLVPGDHARLKFLETTTLPKGKAMYYRRFVDVHTQFPPESLSISMNLMPVEPITSSMEQYEFDLERGIVKGLVGSHVEQKVMLINLAGMIGNESTCEDLVRIAAVASAPRARLAAYHCAAHLMPLGADQLQLWRQAEKDIDPSVRAAALKALSAL